MMIPQRRISPRPVSHIHTILSGYLADVVRFLILARTSEGADKHTATDKALPSKPHDELPEGHASEMDKIAGKTQKIVGKALNNTDMKDKGELRATAGKEAVKGNAATAPGA